MDWLKTKKTKVLQDSQISGNGIVDGDRELPGPWTIFTQLARLNEPPPKRCTWSRETLTNICATARRERKLPEFLSNRSNNYHQKEKQHWATEKPKLDNARKLRLTYEIDPDDMEFKHAMKNARRELEVRMDLAMSCKSRKTSGSTSSRAPKDMDEEESWHRQQ